MKRILINATQAEELRVAMVNGQLMYDLDIEVPSREQKKSNIYKGVITRVEPSLEAAFVNYGAERHGFLPFKEISKIYFAEDAKSEGGRYNIKDAVKEGQQIIVQVEKEERGNKGAALTSFVSLAGRFLVCMPQNPRAGGVSRRIEGEDREQIRQVMSEIEMPAGMGIIARTAGVGRTTEEMQWDLDYLKQLWEAIESAAKEKDAPFLIYQESDIVIRALRDHYKSDIGEILIDDPAAYDRAHEFMSMVMPNALHKLKKFEDKLPLFNRYQIENQIESAFARSVNLPSGGSIVIDHTEALTAIDINSARATKGSDIEDTALNTNLEAADEIARQLRIRDLGGLVVIDFIDMLKNKNQRDVEQRLRKAVHEDRARVQIGRISRFGLMEMSRQRLRPSLGESSQIVCPRCSGHGSIRDVESLSLSVLRLLEEDALKENTGRIVAKLPVVCATYLLNEKRSIIAAIENRNGVHCVIVPDPNLETPHFIIERVRDDDTLRHESNFKSSYEMTTEESVSYTPSEKPAAATPVQTAAVQRISPAAPKPQSAPEPVKEKQSGLISKMFSAIFGGGEKESDTKPEAKPEQNNARRNNNNNRNRNAQNRNRNPRNQNNRNNPNRAATNPTENVTAEVKANTNSAAPNEANENKANTPKPRNNRNRNQNRNRNRRKNTDANQNPVDQNATNTSAAESTAQVAASNSGATSSDRTANAPVNQNNQNTASTTPENKPAAESKPVVNTDNGSTSVKPEAPVAQPSSEKMNTSGSAESNSPKPTEKPVIATRNVSSVNTPSFAKPEEPGQEKKAPANAARRNSRSRRTEPKNKPEAQPNPETSQAPTSSAKPTTGQPEQSKAAETQSQPERKSPVDSKPIETKVAETKPVEMKAVESKPVAAKPVESKPATPEPIASKPVESKPVESKPTNVQPPVAKDIPAALASTAAVAVKKEEPAPVKKEVTAGE